MSHTDPKTVTHAVCGAYLLVAFSDGEFAPIEEGRLMAELAADDAFRAFDLSALNAEMDELIQAFTADYEATALDVLISIASVKEGEMAVRAVKHAARVAIIADQAISPQEEHALERVALALGLDKAAL
ncbi:TerB family tellurite resistance protein [Pyruvatibacter mobilis]|uniref:TerB family tellurite resistance protein n=1 Tax=Pyruvatibacter mobilis TaxID=1712261 RepID=UPI003BA892AB